MTVISPLLKGIPNIMLQRKKNGCGSHLCFISFCVRGGVCYRAHTEVRGQPAEGSSLLPCGCWDSGHQVVSKHLYLLSGLLASLMLFWGLSEAADLGGEHVAGPQRPNTSQYASPSKVSNSPKLGTMPWTCGPLGDTPDISGILLYSF